MRQAAAASSSGKPIVHSSAVSNASSEPDVPNDNRGDPAFPGALPYYTSIPIATTNTATTTPPIPPSALTDLLNLYFHYIYPIMPLIHKETFMRNLANESPLMLNAMYALAARYSKHPAIRTDPDALYNAGDVFYVKARELVDHYMDVPCAGTVNALLVLATYAAGRSYKE